MIKINNSEDYQKALLDPQWILKRDRIISQRRGICEICAERGPVQLHHLAYNGFPWEVPDEWLACLCSSCHEAIHSEEYEHCKKEFLSGLEENGPFLSKNFHRGGALDRTAIRRVSRLYASWRKNYIACVNRQDLSDGVHCFRFFWFPCPPLDLLKFDYYLERSLKKAGWKKPHKQYHTRYPLLPELAESLISVVTK